MSHSLSIPGRNWGESEQGQMSFQQQSKPTIHDMYKAMERLLAERNAYQGKLARIAGLLRESKRTIERLEHKIATGVYPAAGEAVERSQVELFGYRITTSFAWNDNPAPSSSPAAKQPGETQEEPLQKKIAQLAKELDEALRDRDKYFSENKLLKSRLENSASSGYALPPASRSSSQQSPLAQELEDKERELLKVSRELARSERQRQDLAKENERLAQLLAEAPQNLRVNEVKPPVTASVQPDPPVKQSQPTGSPQQQADRPNAEIEADLEDLYEQTQEVKNDLANVRVNMSQQIQNALSHMNTKISQFKQEASSSAVTPARSTTPTKRQRPVSPVVLDMIVLRDFCWVGAAKKSPSEKNGSDHSNKENVLSGNMSDRLSEAKNSGRQAQGPHVLQPAGGQTSDLHRQLFEQQEVIMELEEKIKHLMDKKKNKDKQSKAKDARAERSRVDHDPSSVAPEAGDESIGDMSVCTLDIVSEDPRLLLERIRELKGQENAIQKQILAEKYDLQELETSKAEAEAIRGEYEQYLAALKEKVEELDTQKASLESDVKNLADRRKELEKQNSKPIDPEDSYHLRSKSTNKVPKKLESTESKPKKLEPLVKYVVDDERHEGDEKPSKKRKTPGTTQDQAPSKQRSRWEPQGDATTSFLTKGTEPTKPAEVPPSRGESIRSQGGDFSEYFLLKEKFDEIQVFVTRVAGLMAQSVQKSRGRYASPGLQRSYSPGKPADPLAEWLLASPSKTQIDTDAKHFYIRFRKRFDSGLKENLVSDLLRNFSVFVREKCQSLLDEYDAYYSRLAETLAAVANNHRLRAAFEEVFSSGGTQADYQTLISGKDFEIVFRNVLTSALLKLAKTMTDALDKRFQDVRLRRLTVEKFMERYLVLAPDSPHNSKPPVYERDDDSVPRNRLLLSQYDSHLYESV